MDTQRIKLGLLSSAIGLLLSAQAFAADVVVTDAGKVHFKGNVVDSPCVVSAGDQGADLTVMLSDVALTQFYGASSSTSAGIAGNHKETFTINMEKCSSADVQNITFTFKGTPDTKDPTVLKNTSIATPAAVDVGIAIFDGATKLSLGTASGVLTIPAGETTGHKDFQADYYTTGTGVTKGVVDAVATFDVTFS